MERGESNAEKDGNLPDGQGPMGYETRRPDGRGQHGSQGEGRRAGLSLPVLRELAPFGSGQGLPLLGVLQMVSDGRESIRP